MTWFVCKRKDNVFGLFIGNTIFCFWNILVYDRSIQNQIIKIMKTIIYNQ